MDKLVLYLVQSGVTNLSFDQIQYDLNQSAFDAIVDSPHIKEINCMKFYDCVGILDSPLFQTHKPRNLDILSLVQCGISGMHSIHFDYDL